ncbi:receptor-like protein 6 [Rutidosis leptorrhynchoides]|uniref:receptor-like protein 6 n=1 Tax=Rutidosis leptorrhynchoides TaxID=125765 RepID=UPI003A99DEEB
MSNSKLVYYVLVVFLCFNCSRVSSYFNTSSSTLKYICPPQQSGALLHFKQSLFSFNHPYFHFRCLDSLGYHPIMMNWNTNTDCCDWNGVTCDHSTGDVIGLDLSCGMLKGTIHPNTSFFNLPHLQRLNLAFNDFSGSIIPPEIGRLSKTLTHLSISHCLFSGKVPLNITLLYNLVSLDLSYNYDAILEPHVFVGLLRNFTSLKQLSLSFLNINSSLPSYPNISYPSLNILNLRGAELYGKLPSDIFNIQSLEILDLAENSFTLISHIPSETSLLPNLVSLDLSGNQGLKFDYHILNNLLNSSTLLKDLSLSHVNFSGVLALPHLNNNLSFLNYVDLSYCNLMGSLPKSPLNMSNLAHLDLSGNKLNGTLPSWLFTLPSLEYLVLEDNMFTGDVSFALPHLKYISLAHNQLGGQIDQSLIMKSTNLSHLDLSFNSFNIDWELSTLLSRLTNIDLLDLSYSGLSVTTSNAENISNPNMRYLYLNSCKLKEFPVSLRSMTNLQRLQLTNNEIHGDLSIEADGYGLDLLDLSHNLITSLSQIQLYGLEYLHLQSNQIQGPFPSSICNMSYLRLLDLSNNRFSGEIPRCSGNINCL